MGLKSLGFRGLGCKVKRLKGLGFRGLGCKVKGFKGLGCRGRRSGLWAALRYVILVLSFWEGYSYGIALPPLLKCIEGCVDILVSVHVGFLPGKLEINALLHIGLTLKGVGLGEQFKAWGLGLLNSTCTSVLSLRD